MEVATGVAGGGMRTLLLRTIGLAAAWALPASLGSVYALERLAHRHDWRTGDPVRVVGNLEQDDRGFLWIAGDGLFRFDGREVRPWSNRSCTLVPGSARVGRTSIRESESRTLSRVTATGIEPLGGPDGPLLGTVVAATYADDGALWLVEEAAPRAVWRLDAAGARAALPVWSSTEDVYALRPARGGTIVAITRSRAAWLGPTGARKTWEMPGIRDALSRTDGSWAFAVNERASSWLEGVVHEDRAGTLRVLFRRRARLIELAERGEDLWVSCDRGLVKIARDGSIETIGPDEGAESGGPLLVDREGSLWLGTFRGLLQFPEPDTVGWSDVVHDVGRWAARSPGGETWMVGWTQVLRVTGGPGRWRTRVDPLSGARPCAIFGEHLWSTSGVPYEPAPTPPEPVGRGTRPVPGGPCTVGASGLWIVGLDGLLHWAPGEGRPSRPRAQPPPRPGPPSDADVAVEDGAGRLWVSRGDRICRADAGAILADAGAGWTCEPVPDVGEFDALVATPSGDLWAVVDSKRLLRRAKGRWEPVPAAADLGVRIGGIVPSPAGGFWIAGERVTLRVVERPEDPGGWEVVESLDAWQGLPALSSAWVAEDDSGALWIAGAAGLTYVPPHARRARPGALVVEIAEVLADGKPVDSAKEIDLPYGHNGLELRVAAPSLRDPGRLRHRVRFGPRDPWSTPSAESVFRYQHVPAGRHHVEVEASLDGTTWIAAKAPIVVHVAPPWYLRWTLLVSLGLAAGATAYAVHRMRVARLVGLERQRARIARDLHDEIGSGLGSIGILSELGMRANVEETRRRSLSGEINRVASALSASLTDLEASLRPGATTLESLARQISERARALLPEGTAAVVDRLPDPAPSVALSLAVRRNVLLIATEALHNAARHSEASTVEIGLAREAHRWRVWVADDGKGLGGVDPEGRTTDGLGLRSMRGRAAEIGADLAITAANPSGGTRVSLVFDALAEDRRLVGRRARRAAPRPAPRGSRG